jgi:hypothetical protein
MFVREDCPFKDCGWYLEYVEGNSDKYRFYDHIIFNHPHQLATLQIDKKEWMDKVYGN